MIYLVHSGYEITVFKDADLAVKELIYLQINYPADRNWLEVINPRKESPK